MCYLTSAGHRVAEDHIRMSGAFCDVPKPTGCLMAQFPRSEHRLGFKGSVPQGRPPSDHSPDLRAPMRQTGRKLKIPTTPSSGLTLRCNAQNSGRCFTYFYWFVIKDVTQEQAEGRDALRKAWGGAVGRHRTSHAFFRCATSRHHDGFLNLESST